MVAFAVGVAVAAALPRSAGATEPQFNVGLLPGIAGVGTQGRLWQETRGFGAVQGDAIFGRARDTDLGVGPFVNLGTVGFSDLRAGAGASGLLPMVRGLPLIVSGGAYARCGVDGWAPGIMATAFWGVRGHNYHASYASAVGLSLGWQQDLDRNQSSALVIAAHLDALVLLLPFVVAYEWAAR